MTKKGLHGNKRKKKKLSRKENLRDISQAKGNNNVYNYNKLLSEESTQVPATD